MSSKLTIVLLFAVIAVAFAANIRSAHPYGRFT